MKKIQKILIANRGEIACRIIKTAQKLGIKTVAVFHESDAGSLALRLADETVKIDGVTPVAAYLSIDEIIAACKKTGADAVHPGFGFLSENSEFAKRVTKEGIIFIGPTTDAIAAMGDKIQSKRLAAKSGVPVIPGYDGEITNATDALTIAQKIGFPVMIKATAGGGGKGLRVVHSANDCADAFERTTAEAKAAFGDGRVFIEKFIESPRHIEIQILGDTQGNIIHLGERECSIQRRHQKIIEEAPSSFLDEKTRQKMGQAAIALAKAVNYTSAGTIEFVVDQQRNFYFLEMNARIQVEHPVTEMITGIDIVEQQIKIAQGESLNLTQNNVRFSGHAIECRLCAEDPDRGFVPSSGKLRKFTTPDEPWLRLDSGVAQGDVIGANFDSMLAKLIVTSNTRAEAILNMKVALLNTAVLGVTTNADYLYRILSQPAFAAGDIHTGFLAENEAALKSRPPLEHEAAVILAAALLSNRSVSDKRLEVSLIHSKIGAWRN